MECLRSENHWLVLFLRCGILHKDSFTETFAMNLDPQNQNLPLSVILY